MENIEKHLYIYSKRRARIDKKPQYVDLIPKLFGTLYNNSDINANKFITELKKSNSFNKKLFFKKLLDDPLNYINQTEYINLNDKDKIKKINLDLFDENISDKMFDKFLEHLYRGHADMKYGIYFSLKYAENDTDFINKFKRLKKSSGNDRIIHYAKLSDLLQYINNIHQINNFHKNTQLLYLIGNWNYGFINKDTIKLQKNKNNELKIDKFMSDVISKYPTIEKEMRCELICQIPLENKIFKFFYVDDLAGSEYYKKYIKYKTKYINLQKLL